MAASPEPTNLLLWSATAAALEGLVYRPDFLSEGEERGLLRGVGRLELHEIRMRGQVARRTARHYGLDYDHDNRARLARGHSSRVTRPERRSAGIGMLQAFGTVVGVSAGSSCRMRFRHGKDDQRRLVELELEPRSAYVLAGPARLAWQHSIPPTKDERYSITFRTLKRPRG